MSDKMSRKKAKRMALELREDGVPPEQIVRRLVKQGVDPDVAESVVYSSSSAEHINEGGPKGGPRNHQERTIEEFQRRWNRQMIASLIGVIVVVIVVFSDIGRSFGDSRADMRMLGLLAILPVLIFSFINYRCPACNAYLGKSFRPTTVPLRIAKIYTSN